ncbi:MAG: AAA family ATPase, partial [Cyanobacteria bacterium J06621_15]
MKLQRVQVPDFRVLKNVDISFEKDFVPNIFPLGSQNGGGKSTLLQLIFVLLHCSGDSEKHEFIKNMLYGFEIDDSGKGVLAAIDIWDGEKTVSLEFIVCHDSYIKNDLNLFYEPLYYEHDIPSDNHEGIILSAPQELIRIENEIKQIESQISKLAPLINRLQSINDIENPQDRESQLRIVERSLVGLRIYNFPGKRDFKERIVVEDMKNFIVQQLSLRQSNLQKLLDEREKLKYISPKIKDFLHSNNIIYIFSYSDCEDNNENKALLCRINILNPEDFLAKISNNVFLAAPTTQVFLFLSQDARKLLFKQQINYQSQIQKTKSKLAGFFPYDFLAVNLLVEIFKSARDKDFKQAIETGEYGNNYQQLVNDLNQILLNKKININPDLSGFTFKLDAEGQDIELYPEDLSHGELKRLSIYAWIKYNIIEDSIVLIDEIENGFHPDWQYQIIKDIAEGAPENQYIISTHS